MLQQALCTVVIPATLQEWPLYEALPATLGETASYTVQATLDADLTNLQAAEASMHEEAV